MSNVDVLFILIRGAPGIGKSTIANALKRKLSPCALIEVDQLRAMRSPVNWTDDTSHKVGLNQTATLGNSFVQNGVNIIIIVDTLLGDNLLFLQSLIPYKMVVVTLTASEEILLKRARARSAGFADERIIKEMNKWFQKSPCERIDTSLLAVNEITHKIIEKCGIKKE